MESLGFELGKDLFYYLDEGGQHNEYYWWVSFFFSLGYILNNIYSHRGRRFDVPMKDLYPITNSPTTPNN